MSVPADTLSTVALSQDTVTGGIHPRGTVTLSGPAPAGGLAVTLSSDKPAVATVPQTVMVEATQQRSREFEVTTKPVAQTTEVTITASLAGVSERATLTVNPALVSLLSLSQIFPPDSRGLAGETGHCTATLSGAAPAGGLEITLSSSNTDVATVQSSVTVGQGERSADFDVTTKLIAQTTPVTITASLGRDRLEQQLVVETHRLVFTPDTFTGGAQNPRGEMLLSRPAPAGGLRFTVVSDKFYVVQVGRDNSVTAGHRSAGFPVRTSYVHATTEVTITATIQGVTLTKKLRVNPPASG